MGDDLCAHGFTGARRAEEQHRKAAAVLVFAVVVPVLVDRLAEGQLLAGVLQGEALVGVHDDVVPAELRGDARGLLRQLMGHLAVAGLEHRLARDELKLVHRGEAARLMQGAFDLAGREEELRRELLKVDVLVEGIALRVVVPDLDAFAVVRRRDLKLGEVALRDLLHRQLFLADGEDRQSALKEFREGEVHVAEELVLLLLVVGKAVHADAGVRQNALAAGGPQGLFDKGEVVDKELCAVHRNAAESPADREVRDGELAAGALVAPEGDDAAAVVPEDVDGVEDALVRDEGVGLAAVRQAGEEAVVVFVDLRRVRAVEEVDEALVGRQDCRKRQRVVDLQRQDRLKRFEREGHLAVSRGGGERRAEIDARGGFDRRRGQAAVLVDDLKDRGVARLRRGDDRARETENAELGELKLFAQGVKRHRDILAAQGCAADDVLDAVLRCEALLRQRRRCRRRCRGRRVAVPGKFGKEVVEVALGLRFRGGFRRALLLRRRAAHGFEVKFVETAVAEIARDLDVRVDDILVAAVFALEQRHQAVDIAGQLQVDAGEQVVRELRIACKRQVCILCEQCVITFHKRASSDVGEDIARAAYRFDDAAVVGIDLLTQI